MAGIILCRSKMAKVPYHIDSIDVNIYSLEELCYYIYNNIYLVNAEMFNDTLFEFIRNETGDAVLADRLCKMVKEKEPLAVIVITVLKYVDYYNDEEINKLQDVLETLNMQNVNERLKARADIFMENGHFARAILNYQKIISAPFDNTLSGLFYAKVYHNLGTAFAHLFMYRQAAKYFLEAYRIGQHGESKKCYMAAVRFARGENVIENDDTTAEEYELKKKIETAVDNARYSDEYREIMNAENEKDPDNAQQYYNKINQIISKWKNDYKKYMS